MKNWKFHCLCLCLIIACKNKNIPFDSSSVKAPLKTVNIHLGQGMMAGEISDNTAILQARLTQADSLIHGHLIGQKGWLKFQYYEKEKSPKTSHSTEWM